MSHVGYKDQVVWIIGASSGIGHALASELAERGAILALSARRREGLEDIIRSDKRRGAVFVLDATDADIVRRTAQAICAAYGRIDRVIFLAAAYTPMKMDALDLAVARQIVDTNISAAFNVIHAVMPIFRQQNTRVQVALCGSIAGYIGLPGGQPYSATKAAVINLAESLYAECSDNIDVKLISPGFVRTPLTDKNSFNMPFMIEPEQAAKEIARGLLSSRFEIHFPKKMTLLLKIVRFLPYWISLRLIRTIKA